MMWPCAVEHEARPGAGAVPGPDLDHHGAGQDAAGDLDGAGGLARRQRGRARVGGRGRRGPAALRRRSGRRAGRRRSRRPPPTTSAVSGGDRDRRRRRRTAPDASERAAVAASPNGQWYEGGAVGRRRPRRPGPTSPYGPGPRRPTCQPFRSARILDQPSRTRPRVVVSTGPGVREGGDRAAQQRGRPVGRHGVDGVAGLPASPTARRRRGATPASVPSQRAPAGAPLSRPCRCSTLTVLTPSP